MRTLGLHHVAIQVQDVEKVAAFYRDVLELPERARHVRDDGTLRSIWIEASSDGSFIAIEELRPEIRRHAPAEGHVKGASPNLEGSGTLGHSLVALRIARAERVEWLRHFEKHGVAIEKQSTWTIYVRDPEGNVIGLSHHPHDPL